VDYGPIDLRTLLQAELSAHGEVGGELGKVLVDGPHVLLPALSAQTMALALHELATNAVKYGALKQASGHLSVTWRIQNRPTGERSVVLDWQESGVAMPKESTSAARRGYGTEPPS
jgi:two-component sensor histidine kinase